MKLKSKMTESEFNDMQESNMGFCVRCNDWTHESTEPDADGYQCPICKNMKVVGSMIALLDGFVDIEG